MEFIKEMDEAIALWGEGNIRDAVFNSAEEDLFEFVEVASLISRHHFGSGGSSNENFSFIANSALSGGPHPCSARECRKRKLDQLVSFASLYADEVYIQSPFESVYLRGDRPIREIEREEVLSGISNYLYLKPLIDIGLIKYASVNASFCDLHAEKIAKPLSASIAKKEEKLYQALEGFMLERCKVTFDFVGGNKAKPFFEVTGPEEIIEHGAIYFHAHAPISSLFLPFMEKSAPYSLEKDEVQECNILHQIVGPIVHDLSIQEWHSALNGTSYLCDNRTSLKVASKINSKAYIANSAAFENAMKHYLPTVHFAQVSSILDLRKKEEEAFAVYRDKLNKLMRETRQWNEEEVSKIFRDEILPEINIIDKKIKDWKENSRTSIAEKVLFGVATASFGLYGGVLPSNIGDIVAALGGTSAVVGPLLEFNQTLKEKQEARKNDFYFLWQAGR
ncbi:hypothetical protein [Hydrogenophaga taeniospiralis]|uniref:hypothetical protein n=1 Tax=Hydrogenophaga taeniospiralis TaxID=65656 RepID=UPI000A5DE952|nr:hypothetical protein [Hydrogenophaga taeniospiralis]